MSEIKKLNLENKEAGKVRLPIQFDEPIRTDLIHRAVIAQQANARQPYGASPGAGMRHAAKLSRRRRKYRGSYGHGISRVPRKIHSKSGTRFGWVGAWAPMTVGGRRAHPPKAETVWGRKINVTERRKAIRSALAATMDAQLVASHGHRIPTGYPFAVESGIEDLKQTKEVFAVLKTLGLGQELERTSQKQARAGKGKMRGRKFRTKSGPLLVVSKNCALVKAARNIPGVQVCMASLLNAELLAPGAVPGRLAIFSDAALESIGKEQMFLSRKKEGGAS